MADIGGDAVVRTAPTPAGENGGADRGGAPTADAGQAGAGAVQPGAGTPAPAGSAGQNGTSRLVAVSDPHPPVNVNPAATKEAAIVYLDTVRQRLQRTNPDLYHRFLDTMKDFRSHRLTPPVTVTRIKDMFKEHPDLIAGFAQFLPETASVTYDGREPRKRAADALGNLVPGIAAKRLKALGGNAVDSSKPLSERLGLAGAEQPDEYKFFEMLKEHLPKPVYAQYLKLLTLFSHEIIDRRALVEQSKPYFGRGPAAKELRRMLRAIVKPRARIRDYVMTSGLPAIVSQQVEAASKEEGEQEEEEDKPFAPSKKPDIDLKTAKRVGHSYRKYPPNYPIPKASGRDALCQSVLNDYYVSHPTFISEDAQPATGGAFAGEASGAAHHSHRNHFEEAMHKTEDERLEVDLGIDVNLALIKLLEPVERKLHTMSEDEKAEFTLPGWTLGGRSRSLPFMALQRVYGDASAAKEVLQALAEAPVDAVPLVLARLKKKDEEWRQYKRQRNDDVWCAADASNFPKALDYRGIAARAVDKKVISPKAFIQEAEQHGEKAHYRFEFADPDVFADVGRLLEWYLATGVDPEEIHAVRSFVGGFVREFFKLDAGFKPATGAKSSQDGHPDKDGLIFTNENVFCFFRLFWTVYSRLQKVKQACKEVDALGELPLNRTAISLGLQEVPSTPQAPGTDEEAGADDEKRSAYDEVLSMIRKLIDATFAEGQAFRASNDFEDACRKLLGTHGYPIYTADYLAQSLEKIAYTVSEDDSDSARIFELWKEWKNTTLEPNALQVPEEPDVTMAEASEGGEGKPEAPKWTEEGEYGERTKQLCKDENSFKIRYDASQRVLDIYILAKPQIKISEKRTSGLNLPEEIDAHYLETMDALQAVEQYAKDGPPVLLKRSLRRCLTTTQKDIRKQRYGLVVSLAPDSLRMQYKRDSEDWFFRPAETFFDENNRALSIWTVHKRLRRKRNARFVRWLSELETKSQYPAESNDALQKVLFGDQGTGFETRRELVINRASALKYAVYRTYRQDQVPRGPLRTFTLDDTDSLVIKLKKKVDRNDPYAQDESEDAMDVDLSAPQSPAAAKQPTAPKQQVIQRPQAGPKQSGMQQQQHQQQQQRKQPASSRKKAAAPVKAAPKLGPQLQTRITKASRRSRHVFKPPRRYMREGYDRKSKPPKRRDPGLLQLFAKPPKVRLTVEDRLSDRKTWNRHFIRVMTGMVKDRQIKLSSSDLQEEWHLDQLLMARGIHRAPGVFTAKFHEGRDSAGIIFDKFKVVHHNGPLPMPFKKLCRNVNWLPPDVVPPYLTTPQAPHMGLGRPVRKTTPPKRFVPRNPQMAAPGAVRGQGADLDFMMFRYNVPKEASTELRRGRNLRFIKWMGAQMDAKDYPLDADADLDDWLMARGKYAVRTQYGMVTTEQRVVSLNDAALRLTYYHTVIPGPPVGVPGGTKRR